MSTKTCRSGAKNKSGETELEAGGGEREWASGEQLHRAPIFCSLTDGCPTTLQSRGASEASDGAIRL